MATVIEGDLKLWKSKPRHPWTEWFDGRQWQLTRGSDFQGSTFSMRNAIYAEARRRGMAVSISINSDEEGLRLQARPKAAQ